MHEFKAIGQGYTTYHIAQYFDRGYFDIFDAFQLECHS